MSESYASDAFPDFDAAVEEFRSRLRNAVGSDDVVWLYREDVRLMWRRGGDGRFQIELREPSKDVEFPRRHYDWLTREVDQIVFELIGVEGTKVFCTVKSDTWDVEEDDFPSGTKLFLDVAGGMEIFVTRANPVVWWLKTLFQCRRPSGLDFMYLRSRLKRSLSRWKKNHS